MNEHIMLYRKKVLLMMDENPCLPCNLWESVTAGHVQRCPSFFISLVDICSILDQQLHTL